MRPFIIANGNATAVGTILDNDDSPEIAIIKLLTPYL
jgi:hypothetical protein